MQEWKNSRRYLRIRCPASSLTVPVHDDARMVSDAFGGDKDSGRRIVCLHTSYVFRLIRMQYFVKVQSRLSTFCIIADVFSHHAIIAKSYVSSLNTQFTRVHTLPIVCLRMFSCEDLGFFRALHRQRKTSCKTFKHGRTLVFWFSVGMQWCTNDMTAYMTENMTVFFYPKGGSKLM